MVSQSIYLSTSIRLLCPLSFVKPPNARPLLSRARRPSRYLRPLRRATTSGLHERHERALPLDTAFWNMGPTKRPTPTTAHGRIGVRPAVACLALLLPGAAGVMHTVFSTECSSYFDWQSVAMFYSHNQVEQPGYITRLMACDHPGHYPGLDIGPTYIHPNYGNPKTNLVQDHYTPYNKPGSLYHWLFENRQVPEADHVLVVEPDMIFRKPIDCEKELAVRSGVVATAPYGYLSGTDNGMAAQFVGAEILNRLDKVGGFYCFRMDDLRRVVPAWLNYTKAVRTNPGRYWQIEGVGSDFPTGDAYVERGHAPWISEMYGYIFGAGSVGLQHAVRDDIVLFAGLSPTYEPSLIHYGLYCQEGQRTFNKLSYKSGFSPSTCEQYFPEPMSLESMRGLQHPGAELICVELIAVINEALCEYHTRTCCNYETVSYGCHNQQLRPLLRTEEACARSCCSRGDKCSHYVFGADGRCMHSHFRRGQCGEGELKLEGGVAGHRKIARHIECPAPSWSDVQRVQDEEEALGGVSECKDLYPECKRWAQEAQCELNPDFMKTNCPATCRIEGCWNKHTSCEIWAGETGQCEENFQYMLEHCPVACRQRREKQLVEKKAQAIAAHAHRREVIQHTEQLKEVEEDIAEEDEADEEAAVQTRSSSQQLQQPEWQQQRVGAQKAAELAEFRPAMMVTQAPQVDRTEAIRARAEQAEIARSARGPSGVVGEEEVEIAWGRVVAFAAACSAMVFFYRWFQSSKSWRSHKIHVQLGKGV